VTSANNGAGLRRVQVGLYPLQTSTLEGAIEATNATGLKLGGVWYSVSQYRPLELPPPGAHVRLVTDAKRFIRSLEVLGESQYHQGGIDFTTAVSTRLAVLSAAASFLGQMGQCRPEVRSEHVLVLADKWLAWVEEQS